MKSSDNSCYDALIEELFRRHPSVQNTGFSSDAYKPGLDAMKAFAAALGNPEREFKSVHVAGTNGKGSVCSMLAAALSATGLSVGLYTSPHLVDFRERMKIISGGKAEMISKDYVLEFLQNNPAEGLSFFEITTGMAFRWFADRKVDVAVIETGLGGRLDSTNIIVPELSIISSIGLDHCALLGSTRAAIASEKAGIFKPGVPAVVAAYDAETGPVFERAAAAVHCPLFFVPSGVPSGVLAETLSGVLPEPPEAPKNRGNGASGGSGRNAHNFLCRLDLEGPCQEMNLRTVLFALKLLGVEADMDAIAHTARITALRGRWERLSEKPEVICDIGHNPPALEVNFRKLEMLKETGRPLVIVYGIMADKDLAGIAPLMPAGATYFLAAPATERALDESALLSRLSVLRPDLTLFGCTSVADAVSRALTFAEGLENPLVYIGGSTFVVSEAIISMQ